MVKNWPLPPLSATLTPAMADEPKPPDDLSEDEQISLNIVHHFPENLPLVFSDNVAIQHTPSEFIVTFSQVRQPLVGKAEDYEKMESIRADVVARIVLTPAKMAEFLQALQANWRTYERRIKALMAKTQNVGTPDTTKSTSSEN